MLVLGIETSCDETGVALYDSKKGLLGHTLHSQIKLHAEYGGVVPELASRDHIRYIIPLIDQLLKEQSIKKEAIDSIAYTSGPGLSGALLVGSCVAEAMACSLNIPSIPIHHLEGHLLSPMLDKECPSFPFLALLVSGGHSQLIHVRAIGDYSIVGDTLDDAAGEAFDKSAKILGLPYPGGPHIDKHAKKGNIHAFEFGKPKIKDLDFSFSGLKTSILYKIQNNLQKNPRFIEDNLEDLCASIQHSIVTILLNKLEKAIKITGIKQLAIAGGVSANSYLRSELEKLAKDKGYQLYIPKFEYCTDNAAMIAITGYFKYLDKDFADQSETPSARLSF